MGSLGLPEIAFIFILALLIFGPKRLPEIGRTLGRGMAEFRKASNELKRSINTELALDESPIPPAVYPRRIEDPSALHREAAVPPAAPAAPPAETVTAEPPAEPPAPSAEAMAPAVEPATAEPAAVPPADSSSRETS
jgi:sec-independent protein translocase protein TatA